MSSSHTRPLARRALAALLLMAQSPTACRKPPEEIAPSDEVAYTEQRQVCTHRTALRKLLWGDLHAHSARSWDAYGYHLRVTPAEAYDFARGGTVMLPPLDSAGVGTRPTRLGRPLDFAAVTDHAEFFGELRLCTTNPTSAAYASATCQKFRQLGTSAVTGWGMQLIDPAGKQRFADVCGADGAACAAAAATVWKEIQQAAEQAYDRTARCGFTSFVAYEYTATPLVSNQHRNVIFRNATVPRLPASYYEAPGQWELWSTLKQDCLDAGDGCDLVSIPHNPNWSNGTQFVPDFASQTVVDTPARAVALRAELEPLLEIFQHKGEMECQNGLSGALRTTDPQCEFEKIRFSPFGDCGTGTGWGGVNDRGCISRYDFLRGILLQGLLEQRAHGVNPYRLGVIGSTDSHNGTPGNTWEHGWPGHVGSSDDEASERLGPGNMTHRGLVNNPGGLAAVWAVENSRDAIFEAIRRREVYATSGTRIELRFFGGWGLESDLCARSDRVERGYRGGVPMGGVLPAREGPAPRFVLSASHDPGSAGKPGARLQQAQIVKGWIDAAGAAHERVYSVAGSADSTATVDPATCKAAGDAGRETLCVVWSDPDFDPGQRAFYFARVLERPTCRWSAWLCNGIKVGQRPPGCTDPNVQQVIQERAWSSPIWYEPGA